MMKRTAFSCLVLCACTHPVVELAPKRAPVACPIVPLRLVFDPARRPDPAMLSLDDQGGITSALSKGGTPLARLDPRGCVVSPDGVEVELTSRGELWTTYQRMRVEGNTIQLGSGDAMRIADDGTLERLERDGTIQHNPYGKPRFEGYLPEARCAALLLTGTFMLMIPSMAVADGVARKEPAPEPSVCADLRARH